VTCSRVGLAVRLEGPWPSLAGESVWRLSISWELNSLPGHPHARASGWMAPLPQAAAPWCRCCTVPRPPWPFAPGPALRSLVLTSGSCVVRADDHSSDAHSNVSGGAGLLLPAHLHPGNDHRSEYLHTSTVLRQGCAATRCAPPLTSADPRNPARTRHPEHRTYGLADGASARSDRTPSPGRRRQQGRYPAPL
jgi:hypothetical protein